MQRYDGQRTDAEWNELVTERVSDSIATEREACAKIADMFANDMANDDLVTKVAGLIASLIRDPSNLADYDPVELRKLREQKPPQ